MLQAQGIDADTPPVQPGAQAGADKVVQPRGGPRLIPLTVSQRAQADTRLRYGLAVQPNKFSHGSSIAYHVIGR